MLQKTQDLTITCIQLAAAEVVAAVEEAAATPRVPGEEAVAPIAYWAAAEYPA